ncbi:MAG: hypothetical protein C0408_09620, partial [Odoribacter sp.]|nr:hypothetical protein [Odoribacter sp.]
NESAYIDIICRLSALIEAAPEIFEMDINPLMGTMNEIVAVDARIRIEKDKRHPSERLTPFSRAGK